MIMFANVVPIDALLIALSVPLFVFLLFSSGMSAGSAATRSYSWALVFMLFTVVSFALPVFMEHDLVAVQLSLDVSYLFYGFMLAFFARMISLFIVSSRAPMAIMLPALLAVFSVALFVWQMNTTSVANYISFFTIGNIEVVAYMYGGPLIPQALYGLMGLLVFGVGAVMFYRQIGRNDNPVIKKRAKLFSAAFSMGFLTVMFEYFIAPVAGTTLIFAPFMFLMGGMVAAVGVLLFIGTRLRVENGK